ncbi:MAG: MurR/RpiR family transcriptional regulator [Lachnoclostridium edouardi]|uniref:MurR/RpiR family transcriptional regulator n=1 Tax=Lachnoclostridium edouardi TaxID=1926283 RepID=UPI0026DAC918|nr:MurR/RpiR family transcriptional regulator [Lachnoclostridium edouardi]MDO4279916.1 MurR/RpiR family transcriptional regulator [Lachnoclostridium edouardi]
MMKNLSEYSTKISHSCLIKFQFIYDDLKSAEKKAADFCLSMPEFVASATIGEVAGCANCSEATFVRLAKRLGYSGYPELRECLLREDSEEIAHSVGIEKSDDIKAVTTAVFKTSILALNDSLESIDFGRMEKAVELILKANRILFAGAGDANVVALSGVGKFTRMGLPVNYSTDFDTQLLYLSQMDQADVLICISHSGKTKTTCDLAKAAASRNIPVVSLTNFPQSPLSKVSDVVLLTASFAHDMMGETISKRIPALCLIDAIYVAILFQLSEKQLHILDSGNKILRMNKL